MRRLLMIVLSLSFASRAIADGNPGFLTQPTEEQGLDHLRRGRAAYKLQDWDEAIKEFKAGVYTSDLAIWLWNLGQAYRMAGRCKEAVAAYESFTSAVRNEPEAARFVLVAQGFINDCNRALEKADEAASRPPTSLDGNVTPAPSKALPPLPEHVESIGINRPTVGTRQTIVVRPRWYNDTLGWSLAAGAVVVGGIGASVRLSVIGLEDKASHASTQREQVALQDRADWRALEGNVMLAGAGVVAVAAIVRLVLVPEPRTIQLEAGPTHVGIRGTF